MVQYYLGCLHHCLTLPIPSPGIFDHKFMYYCCANVLFPINLLSFVNSFSHITSNSTVYTLAQGMPYNVMYSSITVIFGVVYT